MTKHTPGPWYAWNIQLGPEGKGPYSFPLGRDSETAAGNARLIAAAPEMLEALRGLLHEAEAMNSELRHIGKGRPDGGAHPDSPLDIARETIHKAEGGE